MSFALVLLLPWIFALILTPLVIRFAHRHDLLDYPTTRKAHARPTPLLGGVAVLLAVVLGVGAASWLVEPFAEGLWGYRSLSTVALGIAVMTALGLYDDFYDLSAVTKALAQVAVGVVTYWAGFRVGEVQLPFDFVLLDAWLPSLVLTVGWVVIVTNAFNLIDGVDGLATGLGVIAAITMFWVATDARETIPILGALAFAGALAGFLRFNLPPARIFLGDAGAYGIGYAIAVLSMASFQKAPTAMVIVVPLLAAGLPMIDTLLAIARRARAHVREKGWTAVGPRAVIHVVMSADRGHVHHLLQRAGYPVRTILAALYGVSIVFAMLALATRHADANLRWGVLALLLVAGYVWQRWFEQRVEERERLAAQGIEPELRVAARRAAS